jgi:hypothetical protein
MAKSGRLSRSGGIGWVVMVGWWRWLIDHPSAFRFGGEDAARLNNNHHPSPSSSAMFRLRRVRGCNSAPFNAWRDGSPYINLGAAGALVAARPLPRALPRSRNQRYYDVKRLNLLRRPSPSWNTPARCMLARLAMYDISDGVTTTLLWTSRRLQGQRYCIHCVDGY